MASGSIGQCLQAFWVPLPSRGTEPRGAMKRPTRHRTTSPKENGLLRAHPPHACHLSSLCRGHLPASFVRSLALWSGCCSSAAWPGPFSSSRCPCWVLVKTYGGGRHERVWRSVNCLTNQPDVKFLGACCALPGEGWVRSSLSWENVPDTHVIQEGPLDTR